MPATTFNEYPSLFYDLARGKHAVMSLSQPVIGAVLALNGLPSAQVMIIGSIAALSGYFALLSMNDILDHRIDRKSLEYGKAERDESDIGVVVRKHPLAWGDLSLTVSITWVASLSLLAAVLAWYLSPACLLAFAGCAGLEVIYCALRRVTWTKTFISGITIGLGGLAGWLAVAPLDRRAIYVFFFLALWEIYGRNLANDMCDVVSDRSVGIRTLATTYGTTVSAYSISAGAVVTTLFLLVMPLPLISIAIAVALALPAMLLPAIDLARHPDIEHCGAYFNRVSHYPVLFLLALVPVAW